MEEEFPKPKPKKYVKEAVVVFAITSVIITVLDKIPFLQSQMQGLVAALFIGIPWWVLKQSGETFSDIGAIREDLWSTVKPALVLSLLIFPIYVVGYHGVQTVLLDRTYQDARLDVWQEESSWSDWLLFGPKPLENRPSRLGNSPVEIWEENDTLSIVWNGELADGFHGTLETDASLELDGYLSVKKGGLYRSTSSATTSVKNEKNGRWLIRGKHQGGIRFNLTDGSRLSISWKESGPSFHTSRAGIGEFGLRGSQAGLVEAARSYGWLLGIVLLHILLVGGPEEIFYRGFIQTRLQKRWGSGISIWGGQIGLGVIFTSVLFALGHFVIAFNPNRLIVFFPSLLFGWMKNRWDTVGSVAVFHGLCNVLLNIIQRYYTAG